MTVSQTFDPEPGLVAYPTAPSDFGTCARNPARRHRRSNSVSGRRNHFAGVAAEVRVESTYRHAGYAVRGTRVRTPHGEIDLVLSRPGELVFVEVKRVHRLNRADSPVSSRQWQRLEAAAECYMLSELNETGVQPYCRFDVAVMNPDGSVAINENARSFDCF